ncbi:hypothetical protein [Anaeromicropila populeti]|uniref:Uncharacterized protein n=1 Tax=Anaeromicropila populeti TaxID=37658 RepID=A0A1I6KJ20_9FIRM|nr:hypothetical protein [Anaeromicropila populeti]SFR91154.1 hypothetical protein SAMN05661086_02454 [Anaeromicropila populeti]
MNNNLKHVIKDINNGKNLEENLPLYFNSLFGKYYEQSILNVAMEYYTVLQQQADGLFNGTEEKRTVDFMNGIVNLLFVQCATVDKYQEAALQLEMHRAEVIRKMEVLTAYIDQVLLYEYVLNRLEKKYVEQVPEVNEEIFVQKLVQYIFGTKENFIINERIKETIGQLPVRMARSKYYELLKNSLTLYKGADKSSVKTYLYMLRTSANLYKPEGMEQYFTEIGEMVSKFHQVDYDTLSKEEHKQLSETVIKAADMLKAMMEEYVCLQTLLNDLYVYVLAYPYGDFAENDKTGICRDIIKEAAEYMQGEAVEESESIEEKLVQLEGLQETLLEDIVVLEGILPVIGESYGSLLQGMMLEHQYKSLERVQQLMSTSLFMEFTEEAEETADEAYISEVTNELIEELTLLFKSRPIRFIRAVIANTIDKMPVFFNSADEVTEYIQNSLQLCNDVSEKQAAIEILNEIIEESELY